MLEFLRKHTLVVMGAMVLVFFGLVFIESRTNTTFSTGGPARVKVGNISYTDKDLNRIAEMGIRVASQVPSLFNFIQLLAAAPSNETGAYDASLAFLANYGIIKQEAERYGIYPSSEEIDETIKGMPEFCKEDGTFNPEAYRELVSMRGKNAIGEVEESLREVVATWIRFNRLESILTDGISMNEEFVKDYIQSMTQDITVNVATLNKEDFRPKTEPGEEEIKAFWEKRSKNYLSDEIRDLTVYIFTPKAKIVDKADTKIPAATLEVLNVVELLWEKITDANGKNLDEVITSATRDFESLMTVSREQFDNITMDNAPDSLKLPLNPAAGAMQKSLIETAFSIDKHIDAEPPTPIANDASGAPAIIKKKKPDAEGITAERISNTLVLDDGRIALVCVNKIVPIAPLPYNQARAAARADYLDQLTTTTMENAGKALKEKLDQEGTDIEKFKAAATAAGAKLSFWGPYNKQHIPDNMPDGLTIFDAVRKVNVGESTEPVTVGGSVIIAQLTKKTITDTPENKAIETYMTHGFNDVIKRMILMDWLANCYTRYKVTFQARGNY